MHAFARWPSLRQALCSGHLGLRRHRAAGSFAAAAPRSARSARSAATPPFFLLRWDRGKLPCRLMPSCCNTPFAPPRLNRGRPPRPGAPHCGNTPFAPCSLGQMGRNSQSLQLCVTSFSRAFFILTATARNIPSSKLFCVSSNAFRTRIPLLKAKATSNGRLRCVMGSVLYVMGGRSLRYGGLRYVMEGAFAALWGRSPRYGSSHCASRTLPAFEAVRTMQQDVVRTNSPTQPIRTTTIFRLDYRLRALCERIRQSNPFA